MFGKNKDSKMLSTRIAQRKSTNVKGLYKVLDRDKFYARTFQGIKSTMDLIDISTTGCAFKVDNYIPKGSYIEIEIKTLVNDKPLRNPIVVACEAVYCRYIEKSINRIGAKFLEIARGDIEAIRQFTE